MSDEEKADALLDTTYKYCDLIKAIDVEEFYAYNVESFEDVEDYWINRLSMEENYLYTEEEARVYRLVADSFSYTVDEDSLTVDKNTGHVSVTFEMIDYDDLRLYYPFPEELHFIAECAMTRTVTLDIEFVLEKEYWYCSNYERVYQTLFDFTLKDFIYADHIEDICNEEIYWYGTSQSGDHVNSYVNAQTLNPGLIFDTSVPSDFNTVSLEVFYEGESILYLAHTYTTELRIAAYPDLTDDTGLYFREGEYTAYCYNGYGDVIATSSVHVYVDVEPAVISSELLWSNCGGSNSSPGYTNVSHIHCSLQYEGPLNVSDIHYVVEYDGEVISVSYGRDSVDIVATGDTDLIYPVAEDPQYLAPGRYTITFYDSDDEILVQDSCGVAYVPDYDHTGF